MAKKNDYKKGGSDKKKNEDEQSQARKQQDNKPSFLARVLDEFLQPLKDAVKETNEELAKEGIENSFTEEKPAKSESKKKPSSKKSKPSKSITPSPAQTPKSSKSLPAYDLHDDLTEFQDFMSDYGNVIVIQNHVEIGKVEKDGKKVKAIVNMGIQITDEDVDKLLKGIKEHKWLYQRQGDNHLFLYPVTLFAQDVNGEEYIDNGAAFGVYIWEPSDDEEEDNFFDPDEYPDLDEYDDEDEDDDDRDTMLKNTDFTSRKSTGHRVISNFLLRTFDGSYDSFVDVSTEITKHKHSRKYNSLYEDLLKHLTVGLFYHYTGTTLGGSKDY